MILINVIIHKKNVILESDIFLTYESIVNRIVSFLCRSTGANLAMHILNE